MSFTINQAGIQDLQNQLSDGLEAIAEAVYEVAYANAPVETERDPAFTRDTLHMDLSHSREWPNPAVFVATGSGDGFWVHEGTVDTPAHPFLAQSLDSLQWKFAGLMRSASQGTEYGIFRR